MGNTYHFSTLASESNTQNISQFADELKDLRCEFNVRFQDFRTQEVSLKIFASPFDVDVETAPLSLQMVLIDLQENFNLKMKARDISLSEVYQRYIPADKYPKLGDLARKRMALFGSTYVCEQLFSRMKFVKSKTRTKITDSHLENSLKLSISHIASDVERLVKGTQAQSSH